MEFEQVVRGRRSVRDYLPAPVPRATLEHLIEIATQAPSAMNQQPWAFAVITGPARIEDYAQRARQWLLAQPVVTGAARALLEQAGYSVFHRAPALILVLASASSSQAYEDCCLAAQTLMLAAREAELGSCWIGLSRPWLELPQTQALIGIAPGYHVVAPIVLGTPAQWPPAHGRFVPNVFWLD